MPPRQDINSTPVVSAGGRYSLRQSTRRQSQDSLLRSANRRKSSSQASDMPPPNRRLQSGAGETTTGISARGTPATSRSTAYGGRDLQPPTGLTTQLGPTSRSRPSAVLGAAVETSRDATIPAPRSPGSSGRRSSSNNSAFTDEGPLGADETMQETPTIDRRQSRTSRREQQQMRSTSNEQQNQQTRQQQEQREQQRHQQLFQQFLPQQMEEQQPQARPQELGGNVEMVALAPVRFAWLWNGVKRFLSQSFSIWSVLCIALVSVLFLSTMTQMALPSVSSTAPGVYLNGLTDRVVGMLPSRAAAAEWNSTPGQASISSWQFDRLSNRVSRLETSFGSLSGAGKRKTPVRRTNFLAPATGVFVDPYLTSPTRPLYISAEAMRAVPKTFGDILRRIVKMPARPVLLPRTGPGPSSVFQAWDEAGECWCSPPGGSKAQIAMVLPRPVIPQDLVVEHIAEAATLDPGAVPRDLEFWVQIEDPTLREHVGNTVLDVVDVGLPEYEPAGAAPSSTTEAFGTRRALDETWIRIGRFRYDREGEAAQTFHIPVDLAEHNVPVSKVVVRATSAWGQDSSVCLYRLKLHGLAASDVGL